MYGHIARSHFAAHHNAASVTFTHLGTCIAAGFWLGHFTHTAPGCAVTSTPSSVADTFHLPELIHQLTNPMSSMLSVTLALQVLQRQIRLPGESPLTLLLDQVQQAPRTPQANYHHGHHRQVQDRGVSSTAAARQLVTPYGSYHQGMHLDMLHTHV